MVGSWYPYFDWENFACRVEVLQEIFDWEIKKEGENTLNVNTCLENYKPSCNVILD